MEFPCPQCGGPVPVLKPTCKSCGVKISIPTEAIKVEKKVRTEEGLELTLTDEGPHVVYYKMAMTRVREKNWVAAREFFQKVADVDPDYLDNRKWLKKATKKASKVKS